MDFWIKKENKPKPSPTLAECIAQKMIQFVSDNNLLISQHGVNFVQFGDKFVKGVAEQLSCFFHDILENERKVILAQSKNKENNSDNDNLAKVNENVINGLTFKDSDGTPRFAIPSIYKSQKEMQHSLEAIITELSNLAREQRETINEQAKVIQKQHDSILRYENDILYKTKKDLLMELIGIADQIQFAIEDQKKEKDYDRLLDEVNGLGDWVYGSLQTESVRRYEKSKEIDTFDPKCQEVVEVSNTNNIQEDGKILPYLPGYYWTLPFVGSHATSINNDSPNMFEFVLRPERIVRLRFEPEQEQAKSSQTDTDAQAPIVFQENNNEEDNNEAAPIKEISENEESSSSDAKKCKDSTQKSKEGLLKGKKKSTKSKRSK